MPLKKVIAALRKNKRFLITTHLSMEPDALGAEIALYRLLRRLGKEAVIINDDRVLEEYNFLPGLESVRPFDRRSKIARYDCFVIVDCSDLSRCGRVASLKPQAKLCLNLDHHISNSFFADINWVEPARSSASEMVYLLYKKLKLSIDRDVATLLFSGIATDTGFFHYRNTSSFTHRLAAELIDRGAGPSDVYRQIYEGIPFKDARLLAMGYLAVKRIRRGKVAWLGISRAMAKKASGKFDLGEHFLSFMRAIKGVEVAVLFKEDPRARKKEVRVNFRSHGKVDVNRIAGFFGGGGHRTASGTTVAGSLQGVARKVLARVKLACR